MPNRRRIPLLLLALALSSIVAWQMLRPREPIYQGKPESYWLSTLAKPYRAQDDLQQWEALGPDAVPLLLKVVARKEGPFHAAYLALWPKLPPWLKNRCPRPVDRSLSRRRAINLLFEMAHNTPIPTAPLLRAFSDNDPYVRMTAAACLLVLAEEGKLGQDERQVAAALMRAYHDNTNSAAVWTPQAGVRNTVVLALGSLRNQTDITVPFLIKALRDPDTTVRSAATNALKRIGPITAYEAGIR